MRNELDKIIGWFVLIFENERNHSLHDDGNIRHQHIHIVTAHRGEDCHRISLSIILSQCRSNLHTYSSLCDVQFRRRMKHFLDEGESDRAVESVKLNLLRSTTRSEWSEQKRGTGHTYE